MLIQNEERNMTAEEKLNRRNLIKQIYENNWGKARNLTIQDITHGTDESPINEDEVADLVGGSDFRDCAVND